MILTAQFGGLVIFATSVVSLRSSSDQAASLRLCRCQPGAGALLTHRALEFSKQAQHLKHGRGSRRVETLLMKGQVDAKRVQVFDKGVRKTKVNVMTVMDPTDEFSETRRRLQEDDQVHARSGKQGDMEQHGRAMA